MDGRSRGLVPKAMVVAFLKKSKKLLAQTLVYHASEGPQHGQALNKIHKQWRGAILDPLHLNLQCCKHGKFDYLLCTDSTCCTGRNVTLAHNTKTRYVLQRKESCPRVLGYKGWTPTQPGLS